MKRRSKRRFSWLTAVLAVLGVVLPGLSPGEVYSTDSMLGVNNGDMTVYVQRWDRDSGSWINANERDYRIGGSDGPRLYCLEKGKPFVEGEFDHVYKGVDGALEFLESTYVSGNIDISPEAYLKGMYMINEYGYYYPEGLTKNQARYAAKLAMHCWTSIHIIQNGTDDTLYGETYWSHRHPKDGGLRPKPGVDKAQEVYDWAMTLLDMASEGHEMEHSAAITPESVCAEDGAGFTASYSVEFTNMSRGYTIAQETLDEIAALGGTVEGYTGESGDVLTVTIPAEGNYNKTVNIGIKAEDGRSPDNFAIYFHSEKYQALCGFTLEKDTLVRTAEAELVTPERGTARIVKVSSDPGITDGNSSYSLKGAEFGVYEAPEKKEAAEAADGDPVAVLVTGKDGKTPVSGELPVGRYMVKELRAPKGFALSEEIRYITVEAGKTAVAEFADVPNLAPVGILLRKVDADTGEAVPTGSGELKDARFTVKYYAGQYRTAAEAEASGDPMRTWVFRTDEAGKVDAGDPGKYYVSGDDLYLDENGAFAVPAGTVVIRETAAPKGYTKSNEVFAVHFTVGEDGAVGADKAVWNSDTKVFDLDVVFREEARKGGITVRKADKDTGGTPQGAAKLSGIRFAVVNESGSAVVLDGTSYVDGAVVSILETGEDGSTGSSKALQFGDYQVCELRADARIVPGEIYEGNAKLGDSIYAAPGYLFDTSNTERVSLREDGKVYTVSFSDSVARGSVSIRKTPAAGDATGDADLSGIRFAVVNTTGGTVRYKERDYPDGQVIDVLATDVNGNVGTAAGSLPYGKYRIFELRSDASEVKAGMVWASADKGYSLYANSTGYLYKDQSREIDITGDGQELSAEFIDEIVSGGVRIEKWDAELDERAAQGDAGFSGIRFEIVNKSKAAVLVGSKRIEPGAVAAVIETDSFGTAETPEDLLPYGTYEIIESEANGSYLLSDQESRAFEIRENGTVVDASFGCEFKNKVVRGGISFEKADSETGSCEPQGYAAIEGAEITIYNDSAGKVIVNGEVFERGDAVMSLTVDAEGNAGTEEDALPYGTYYALETKAGEGYLTNDAWRFKFSIREDGAVEADDDSLAGPGTALLKNDIIRADLRFTKVDIDGSPLAGIPFLISRLDADGNIAESHVIVSDADGVVDTSARDKTGDAVNSLDEYVSDGVFTDESELSSDAGVWFGEQSARDDGRGALIYAAYRIEELQCEANRGQIMLSADCFIDSEGVFTGKFTDGKVYDLNYIFVDLEVHPESELKDDISGSKVATRAAEVTVTDTVRYDHLKTDREYRIVTEIYHEDRNGSVRKIGEGAKTFRPAKVDSSNTAYGTVDIQVTLDTSELEGGMLHAVDTFYILDGAKETKLLSHNVNMDDEAQTLYVPSMHTSAADKATGKRVAAAQGEAEIVDTVTYESLPDGRTFIIEGTLRFADTGEAVTCVNGKPAVVSVQLTVSQKSESVKKKNGAYVGPLSGQLRMPVFKVDSDALAGRKLVVTEVVYDHITGEEFLSHYDLSDEAQTVLYIREPSIMTSARNAYDDGKILTSNSVNGCGGVVDTIEFSGFEPGRRVIFHGVLMYKASGQPFTAADGSVFEAYSEAIDTGEGSGSAVVVFAIEDLDSFADVELVVFEKAYEADAGGNITDRLIASHEDLEDEAQTVYIVAPEAPVPELPEPEPPVDPDIPRTGDSNKILIYAGAAIVSLLLCFTFAFFRRKNTGGDGE